MRNLILLAACLLTPASLMADGGWMGYDRSFSQGHPTLDTVTSSAPSYGWVRYPDGDSRFWLLQDQSSGHLCGCWVVESQTYLPWTGNGYGPVCDPPINPPVATVLTGVVSAKIEPGQRTIDGEPVTKQEEFAALVSPPLPDDSGKLRLTVIGTPAECLPVLNDLSISPELVALKDKVLVQSYGPQEWPVTSAGLPTDGHPTILLQAPDGTVLAHERAYEGAQALRKIDPDYNPDLDPDPLHRPVPPPSPSPLTASGLPPVVWYGLGGAVVILVLINLKKGK